MLSRSGDIRGQIGRCKKLTEILHVFGPKNFFRGGPPTCPTLAGDSSQIAIMWQSFAAIGRGASEMWLPKITSAVKQKPVRNYRSGRPNKTTYVGLGGLTTHFEKLTTGNNVFIVSQLLSKETVTSCRYYIRVAQKLGIFFVCLTSSKFN